VTLTFYILAAAFDGLGFVITALETRARLAAGTRYRRAVGDTLRPMTWNADAQVAAMIRSAKGDARDADILGGLNELSETIKSAEERLADLSQPAGKNWPLWLGVALLFLGIAFGSAGNISGAS
jgi:uncharacterized membrane protein